MTDYSLWPTTNGPSTAVSYGGDIVVGTIVAVTEGGKWFKGFRYWPAPNAPASPTGPQKFTLWNPRSNVTGTVVPGTVITSGPLVANRWNDVLLATPVPVAIGTPYILSTGIHGNFVDVANSFGAGQPYGNGIVNGPLTAFSASSGTKPSPYGIPQGCFNSGGADSELFFPDAMSSTDNFFVDGIFSDVGPPGYGGPFSLWPNKFDASPGMLPDTAANYVVAQEVGLSQLCFAQAIRYYSPAGTVQLATECDIWSIQTQQKVASVTAPAWSGAAGTGWLQCSLPANTLLPPGQYRVSVYNGAASPDEWSAKELNYWDVGYGSNGIFNGPLSAPGLSSASTANIFGGGGRERGQNTFALGPPNQYPDTYVDGLAQRYFVDLVVSLYTSLPSRIAATVSTDVLSGSVTI